MISFNAKIEYLMNDENEVKPYVVLYFGHEEVIRWEIMDKSHLKQSYANFDEDSGQFGDTHFPAVEEFVANKFKELFKELGK